MNVEIGTKAAQFPEKGIHKWDFRCSVHSSKNKKGQSKITSQDHGSQLQTDPSPPSRDRWRGSCCWRSSGRAADTADPAAASPRSQQAADPG